MRHPEPGPIVRLALLALLAAWPGAAWANAGGVVDREVEYRYDAKDTLTLLTADGQCGLGGFCFRLTPRAHPRSLLKGVLFGASVDAFAVSATVPSDPASVPLPPLEVLDLAEVNAPVEGAALVIGQAAVGDGRWFVYDRVARRYLVSHASETEARAAWRAAGLAEPHLERANDGVHDLPETLRSQFAGVLIGGLFLAPLLLAAALGAGLFWWLGRRRADVQTGRT